MMRAAENRVGIVVIGRNEGERLKGCLRSVIGAGPVVYVDSGSTDGSQDFARSFGVALVELPVPPKFTAARARNAGIAALLEHAPGLEMIQMVDGDCIVEPRWIETGVMALDADPGLAGVFGRRAEIAPDRSIYNRICDIEWNVPPGPVLATGGDALFRVAALTQVGGYADDLIAGEEPDMCVRMARAGGWRFLRVDEPMTRHDAAITRFGQWWKRARRAGYAAAEHVGRHGAGALPGDVAQVRRMMLWGFWLPALALLSLLLALLDWRLGAIAVLLGGLYLLQFLRLSRRERPFWPSARLAFGAGALRVIHQFAAFSGLAGRWLDRVGKRDRKIMEYR
ncbi:glycosyltransferase [Sphingomonas sp. MMS24-J13]|uniref:glycosyltransferase n=1 Tax=Sphingomonas sp. MMS24-J13 TaxID=3238686 RepID=UPI0038508BE1